jgi:hypothetical protein
MASIWHRIVEAKWHITLVSNCKLKQHLYLAVFSTNRAARAMKKTPNNVLNDRISLYYGDITELSVDAIVNPCKRSMLPDDYDGKMIRLHRLL